MDGRRMAMSGEMEGCTWPGRSEQGLETAVISALRNEERGRISEDM